MFDAVIKPDDGTHGVAKINDGQVRILFADMGIDGFHICNDLLKTVFLCKLSQGCIRCRCEAVATVVMADHVITVLSQEGCKPFIAAHVLAHAVVQVNNGLRLVCCLFEIELQAGASGAVQFSVCKAHLVKPLLKWCRGNQAFDFRILETKRAADFHDAVFLRAHDFKVAYHDFLAALDDGFFHGWADV